MKVAAWMWRGKFLLIGHGYLGFVRIDGFVRINGIVRKKEKKKENNNSSLMSKFFIILLKIQCHTRHRLDPSPNIVFDF